MCSCLCFRAPSEDGHVRLKVTIGQGQLATDWILDWTLDWSLDWILDWTLVNEVNI